MSVCFSGVLLYNPSSLFSHCPSLRPNVVVPAQQEPAQDVDPQDPQAALRLDGHDGQDALVQDGVPRVLGALRIGGHLSQCHGLILGSSDFSGGRKTQAGFQRWREGAKYPWAPSVVQNGVTGQKWVRKRGLPCGFLETGGPQY